MTNFFLLLLVFPLQIFLQQLLIAIVRIILETLTNQPLGWGFLVNLNKTPESALMFC